LLPGCALGGFEQRADAPDIYEHLQILAAELGDRNIDLQVVEVQLGSRQILIQQAQQFVVFIERIGGEFQASRVLRGPSGIEFQT